MNRSTSKKNGSRGPQVLRFTARLVQDPKAAKANSWALEIPNTVSGKLHGMSIVEGTINGHPFRTALESNSSGAHSIRVNSAMRKGADAGVGDTVKLAILGPEPAPAAPADLRAAMSASGEAKTLWKELHDDARRVWIRWIEGTNVPETRARRIRRTVEQLCEGKRRPCCVNVYEFMLARVQE